MKSLFKAKVMHRRLRPKENKFTYNVAYLAFSLSEEASLASKWLKYNRFGLYGFYDRDHGARDGSPLLPWIRKVLADHNVTTADGEVMLVAHPRLLGYVFNPVSFWLCFDKNSALRAVLCEVNNTFNENHSYLIAHPDGRAIEHGDWIEAEKLFHVSPFLNVEGHYRFRFHVVGVKLGIWIDYYDKAGIMLHTTLSGHLEELSDKTLLAHFVRSPLMTFGVILRIHWQAVKLWLKKARYHSKPPPPDQEFSR